MTCEAVRLEINQVIGCLVKQGIAVDVNAAILRESQPGTLDVTWAGAPVSLLQTSLGGGFGTIPEYRHIIEHRFYHCMLSDGAVLQLNYHFKGSELLAHRLCYYPCPFHLDQSEIDSVPSGDDLVALFDLHVEQEIQELSSSLQASAFPVGSSTLRFRTPIRFDYDPLSSNGDHPACHLHIQDSQCRWPVYGPLSVGHFLRFVLRLFYPSWWKACDRLQQLRVSFLSRSVTESETWDLFVECCAPRS